MGSRLVRNQHSPVEGGAVNDTHCKHGHPWASNLVIRKTGKRMCRQCDRDRCKRVRLREAEAVRNSGATCGCGCGAGVTGQFVMGHQNRKRIVPAIERLMKKIRIDESSGCWVWIAGMKGDGYGAFGKTRAHVAAYTLIKGIVPSGLELDHTCRNRACVNPDHLEPVTHQVNVLRGEGVAAKRARQAHCVNGHEFTEENTYRFGRYRFCRICRREKSLRWARKKRTNK